MPICNDTARQKLILTAVKAESIAATQTLLERAIARKDSETIQTATFMLQHILRQRVEADAYIRIYKHSGDAFQGQLRPFECKPSDCEDCFWLRWCETKEHFDLMREADAIMKRTEERLETSREQREPREDSSQVLREAEARLREYHSVGVSKQIKGTRVDHNPGSQDAEDEENPSTVGEWDSTSKKWVVKRGHN